MKILTNLLIGAFIFCGPAALAEKLDQNTDAVISRAIDAPARLASDKAHDAARKPTQVLAFFGIHQGQKILDMYSGGGYFDEIFARLVGPKGAVYAHNNKAELSFAKKALDERDYAHRLPNVHLLMAENNHLSLAPASFDVVWYSQSYHDIVLDEPKDGWEKLDGTALRKELFKVLKPGGMLAIIDHRAITGSDPVESGQKLHRIDPAVVKRELEAAGFMLEKSSDLLANTTDDHTKTVFDPAIRGHTDQFIMLFRKPKV